MKEREYGRNFSKLYYQNKGVCEVECWKGKYILLMKLTIFLKQQKFTQ